MNAESMLKEYRARQSHLDNKADAILYFRSKLEGTGGVACDSVMVSASKRAEMAEAIAVLDEQEEATRTESLRLNDDLQEIRELIDMIDDAGTRAVLYGIEFNGRHTGDLARELGTSKASISRIHKEGLEELDRLLIAHHRY